MLVLTSPQTPLQRQRGLKTNTVKPFVDKVFFSRTIVIFFLSVGYFARFSKKCESRSLVFLSIMILMINTWLYFED